MQNNINGGGGRRQVLSSVDFYRRVPTDLTEVSVCVSPVRCLVSDPSVACRHVQLLYLNPMDRTF
jgi:hypothetical protein